MAESPMHSHSGGRHGGPKPGGPDGGKRSALESIVDIRYINSENSVFSFKNEFLSLKATLKNEEGELEEKEYERIFLHRVFPFDMLTEYISVLDKDFGEIGLIRSLDDFDEDTKNKLTSELNRKYYAPKILKILSVKERYGFSYWKVTADAGEMTFTLQDTYRSILKVDQNRVFIIDMDGNRYEIPDTEQLDFKSYKKIELYL